MKRLVEKLFIGNMFSVLLLLISSYAALATSGEIIYENITTNTRLSVDAGKTLTMILKGENFFNTGISVPKGSTLIIKGDGSLKAKGTGFWGYGIGDDDCGKIIIESGDITATAGTYGVAIGGEKFEEIIINGGTITAQSPNMSTTIGTKGSEGGKITINGGNLSVHASTSNGIYCGDNGIITINGGTVIVGGGFEVGIGGGIGSEVIIYGGTVEAHGTGNSGACIGGGEGNRVTINGGVVNAICDTVLGSSGAGIGGGKDHIVTINGGTVTAQAGYHAAAIGGDSDIHGGMVLINGGTVTATGRYDGSCIGGGQNANGGNVIIRGGNVTAMWDYPYGNRKNPNVIGKGVGGSISGTLTIDPYINTKIHVITGSNESQAIEIPDSPISKETEIVDKILEYTYFKAETFREMWDNFDGFYPKKDGWSLHNSHSTFGYEEGYDIPLERWYETYGIHLSSLIVGPILNIFDKWGGSCNGLSMLAVANYNGQIDLKSKFDSKGNFLYDYGQEGSIDYASGSATILKPNSNAVKIIERAQISQASLEYISSKVYNDDFCYNDVIKHIENPQESPLLIKVRQKGVHAMVIDSSKPGYYIGDGWICYGLYDCNAPVGNPHLQSPHPVYQYKQSMIMLNIYTGDWIYFYNGEKVQFGSREKIEFYDISKINNKLLGNIVDNRLTKKFFSIITNYLSKVFISGSNVRVFDEKENIIKIQHGESVWHRDDVAVDYWSDVSINEMPTIMANIPYSDYSFELEDSTVSVLSKNVYSTINSNGSCVAYLGANDESILIRGLDKSNASIALQHNNKDNSYEAIRVDIALDNSSMQMQYNEGSKITLTASDPNVVANIYLDNGKDDIPQVYIGIPVNDIIEVRVDLEQISFGNALTGTVIINGATAYDQPLTASVTNTNNTGVLTYSWKRDGIVVATGETYVLAAEDIGKSLVCEVTSSIETGSIAASTNIIVKQAGPTAPIGLTCIAPTDGGNNDGKIVGTTAAMEYAIDSSFTHAVNCADVETTGLTTGVYYVRYRETDTAYAGESAAVVVPQFVPKVLTGTVTLSGDAAYGQMLTATVTNTNVTGLLTYAWKRDGTIVFVGDTYTLTAEDIGKSLVCEVASSAESGILTASTSIITKGIQPAPIISAINETTKGKADGKIIGMTSAMEISTDGLIYAKVTDPNMLLSAGTYLVRYAETNCYYASLTSIAEIGFGRMLIVTLPIGDGFTATGGSTVEYGADYYFTIFIEKGFQCASNFAVLVNGVAISVGIDGTYHVQAVREDLNIEVQGVELIVTSIPQTGDDSHIDMWVILMLASCAALVSFVLSYLKKI